MGVSGLWTLLEPCGRRIDIKALRGKRLAIGKFLIHCIMYCSTSIQGGG